jgi:[ribosomal protein S5]-alanine N-acetyltransferase
MMPDVEISGPNVRLRYASADDAQRLLELASDEQVTRWFSWGPYATLAEPRAYIDSLPGRRDTGQLLDFVIEHGTAGVIGVTGLSEVSLRDRRATVGTWVGRSHWGSGANPESKALIATLAFEHLGFDRLTAWSNTRNGRSQLALERVGFVREGVLRGWHRHGDERHDVVVFRLGRAEWRESPLREVEVRVSGDPPEAFRLGD